MRSTLLFAFLSQLLPVSNAQEYPTDKCPKDEVACQDVINGSQCLAQIVMDNRPAISAEALAKCVQHEGTASNLAGAVKLCRCPGCHTPPLNAAVAKFFPPPCE